MLRPIRSTQRLMKALGFKIKGTVTGVSEIAVITLPATAGAAQGDYFVFTTQAGVTYAYWLDIDANGTAPTGAAYVAATNKVKVSIITGGLAADTGAALKAVAAPALVTVTDNLNGTVTFTQQVKGATTDPAVHNTGDTGAGSITKNVSTQGVTSTISIVEGFTDAVLTEASSAKGDYLITFANGFGRIPVVKVTPIGTSDVILQVFSVTTTSVRIKAFAHAGVTAKDTDFHMLVMGSYSADQDGHN